MASEQDMLVIALDFDGTLCENEFPLIGNQNQNQKELMKKMISMREEGHKVILYTCRGDTDDYKCLSEAIEWCREQGLVFDAINENIPTIKKISGYSPKPLADWYIDDKALNVLDWRKIDE